MKKVVLIISFLIFSLVQSQAAPQYILIKQTFWGSMRLIHVDKPKKKLHKWYYDSKNDTYYRMKNFFGFAIRIKGPKK